MKDTESAELRKNQISYFSDFYISSYGHFCLEKWRKILFLFRKIWCWKICFGKFGTEKLLSEKPPDISFLGNQKAFFSKNDLENKTYDKEKYII